MASIIYWYLRIRVDYAKQKKICFCLEENVLSFLVLYKSFNKYILNHFNSYLLLFFSTFVCLSIVFGCLATYNHPSAVSHTITFAAAVFKLITNKLNVALNIGPHNTTLPKYRAFITFNTLKHGLYK